MNLFSDTVAVGQKSPKSTEILDRFSPILTEARKEKIDRVIENRTKHVALVLEDVFNHGNISAVLRTAEALGVLRAEIIIGSEKFKSSDRTTQGAHQWMLLKQWKSTEDCLLSMKKEGFSIAVASPHTNKELKDLDLSRPTALLFGNEVEGASNMALKHADQSFRLPMFGFSESFNISVAAALSLQEYFHLKPHVRGDLTLEERKWLRAVYFSKSVRRAVDYFPSRD